MASKGKKTGPQQDDSTQAELVRRFKANPLIFIGTVIVLIIVIVAFVFVPAFVPSAGGLGGELNFGSYNKIPITYVPGNYFAQMRETYARFYQLQGIPDRYIWEFAFQNTVVHTGILDEMKNAGYTVPAKTVDRKVAESPQFQENNVFSVAKYRAMDKVSRMALWRQVQEDIAEEYYRADIKGLRISSKEAPFVAAMGSLQRSFDMAVFPIKNYPDTEIKTYTEAHQDRFLVTHLSQITITTNEREAQQILTSVKEGTSAFEDAARTHSSDEYAEKGGDMGIKMAYEFDTLVPDSADREALTKLAKGELSGLVKLNKGWAFFRAEDAPHQADTSDSAIIEKVRSYIMEFQRGQAEDFFLNQAEAFTSEVKESAFDEVLAQREIEKRTFDRVPLNFGNARLFNSLSSEAGTAQSNEKFWQTLFSTPLLTPSKPLVIDYNVVVLYPTEEITSNETDVGYREASYPSQMSSLSDENIHAHFLKNQKLDDRFDDAYKKYIQSVY